MCIYCDERTMLSIYLAAMAAMAASRLRRMEIEIEIEVETDAMTIYRSLALSVLSLLLLFIIELSFGSNDRIVLCRWTYVRAELIDYHSVRSDQQWTIWCCIVSCMPRYLTFSNWMHSSSWIDGQRYWPTPFTEKRNRMNATIDEIHGIDVGRQAFARNSSIDEIDWKEK